MYRNDIIRLSLFLLLFGMITLFNIWMLAGFISGISDNSTSGLLSCVPKTVINVLFYVLFPVQLLCLINGFFIEGRRPQVTCHKIETPDLAPGEEVRIIHLSDLHLEKIGRNEGFLVKKAGELAPDLILITGDYVNYKSDYDKVSILVRELAAIAPCYLVTGNVDCNYEDEIEDLKNEFAFLESGVTTVQTGSGRVHLAGCDDSHPELISDAVKELETREKGFRVLLYHKPDQVHNPDIGSFNLYLCGHTHGGQVRIPLFGAVITMSELGKAYEMGMYDLDVGVGRGTELVTADRCLRAGQGVAEEKVASELHRRGATKRCDATAVSPEGYGCGQPSASLRLLDDGLPACISSPSLASDCPEHITVSDPVPRQTPCTHLYVNRGYGFEGGSWIVPKVRFLCRPEIAFFEIKGV